jgi:ABC-type nickel/cobalt efflux system permease component RcnA
MIAAITGLIAGLVHVWSGPDHLAAIAPLAVRQPRQAWLPGMRWGLGHSAGVAVVGLLSLLLRDLLPVDLLSAWGERFVGLMLFAIGFWGLRKTFKNKLHTHEHEHDGDRHVHVHVHTQSAKHERPAAHRHAHAAFGIGILHGLAGSSHFLGVLPILAFPTMTQAIAYLAAFAAGTVASMALFAWLMGTVASKFGRRSAQAYRGLMSACSIAAIGVGCFWLVAGFR